MDSEEIILLGNGEQEKEKVKRSITLKKGLSPSPNQKRGYKEICYFISWVTIHKIQK